jgi:hypothetical protein
MPSFMERGQIGGLITAVSSYLPGFFSQTQPAVCVAIVAAAIAFGGLIVEIIGLVIAAKSYRSLSGLNSFRGETNCSRKYRA